MKKILLKSVSIVLTISLLFSQNFSLFASSLSAESTELEESVFSFDEDEINDALSSLNELDAFLEINSNATYETLVENGNHLVVNLESTASPMGMAGQDDGPPLGIPSFLWGCVFGVIGLLIVFVATDNDSAEAKKALWGCLTSSAVGAVLYIVVLGAAAATY
jgi:hypothetical protein